MKKNALIFLVLAACFYGAVRAQNNPGYFGKKYLVSAYATRTGATTLFENSKPHYRYGKEGYVKAKGLSEYGLQFRRIISRSLVLHTSLGLTQYHRVTINNSRFFFEPESLTIQRTLSFRNSYMLSYYLYPFTGNIAPFGWHGDIGFTWLINSIKTYDAPYDWLYDISDDTPVDKQSAQAWRFYLGLGRSWVIGKRLFADVSFSLQFLPTTYGAIGESQYVNNEFYGLRLAFGFFP